METSGKGWVSNFPSVLERLSLFSTHQDHHRDRLLNSYWLYIILPSRLDTLKDNRSESEIVLEVKQHLKSNGKGVLKANNRTTSNTFVLLRSFQSIFSCIISFDLTATLEGRYDVQ